MLKRIRGPKAIAFIVVVAAIVVAAIVAVSRAQAPAGPPQPRIQVAVIQLKPDMMTTWEDLQKNEMIPAQKKAGLPWRHTIANGASGQGFTRVTLVPLANYAQLDMPGFIQRAVSAEANANYNAKLRPTIESQRTSIVTFQLNDSIMSNASAMQPLMVVQVFHTAPGKGAEFEASLKEDYLPAYKKAGFPVAALVDVNREKAEGLAKTFGIPFAATSIAEAIKYAPANAVFDVAVPADFPGDDASK